MSQQNVQFVEALLSATSGMDKQALLGALPEMIPQICTADIEWVEDPQRADARSERGHAAVIASWERWLDQWEEYGWESERFEDCGDNVLVSFREHGRGVASGASVGAQNFAVLTIRDEKVARYREFYDEAAARAAASS